LYPKEFPAGLTKLDGAQVQDCPSQGGGKNEWKKVGICPAGMLEKRTLRGYHGMK
jgi:hypothetical protein